jgi:ubiquinone/menaquinone biosynthesis C-methylase UbiE
MNLEEYEVMYQVEDHHWWYLGMRRITCQILDHMLDKHGPQPPLKILDAGCGTGAVMKYLTPYGEVTGFDFSAEALRFSRQRGLTRLTEASVVDIPFADRQFDLIVSFDVICEMGVDERVALCEFHRILKPGGLVVLRLPAYDWLRGRHDVATHIRHRFTRSELSTKLRGNGLEPVHLSYANSLLFPLVVIKRLSERLLKPDQTGSDLTLDPGPLNKVFRSILYAESPLIRTVGLPFGLTVVAVARRSE